MDYDAILAQARTQRTADPDTQNTRPPRVDITPLNPNDEIAFDKVPMPGRIYRQILVLTHMATYYKTIDDQESARELETQAYGLAGSMLKYEGSQSNPQRAIPRVDPTSVAAYTREQMQQYRSEAEDLAQEFSTASKHKYAPKDKRAYLHNREFGRK